MGWSWLNRAVLAVLAALAALTCSATGGSAPSGPLPGDQVVFAVGSGGGMAPAVSQALASPALLMYGDGRILTKVNSLAIQTVPPRYEIARLDPLTVADFVSSAEATVNPGTDFGTPRVTDVGTTTVTLNGGHGEQQVHVYAFDETFEDRLSTAQRTARAALRGLIDRAAGLAGGVPRAPYSPDRVMVYELDPRSAGTAATVGWPGPPPAAFMTAGTRRQWIACGELMADPAEVVYSAALNNPGALWLVDGATRILAVNPLPLADTCP